MVKVRVADTVGVSLDKQDKLFQSFSQVDGSASASSTAPAWDLRLQKLHRGNGVR